MPVKKNVHETRIHFSRLHSRFEEAEEIIICKSSKPVACLHPIEEKMVNRIPGNAKGKVIIAENFNAPLPQSILNALSR